MAITKAVIRRPNQGIPETGIAEDDVRLAGGWITGFNGNHGIVHARLKHVAQINDAPAVAGPGNRTVLAALGSNQPPGMIPVGIHEPQFLTVVVAASESNLFSVRRDGPLLGIVSQLVSSAAQDGKRPQARLALRPLSTRSQDPSAVGKPAHIARLQIVRLSNGVRFAGTQNAKE